MESTQRFPLFPLGLVLLPGEVVPLHIFEERYRVMIGECLDQNSEFGIVWSGDHGISDIGCAAEVTQLIDRLEDGRLNILVQGTRPFRIDRRVEDMAYPAGDVEWLEDEGGDGGEHAAPARSAYADLVEKVTESRPSETDLGELDAYGMAATIAFEASDKQELLELRTEDDRMERLTALCTHATEQLTESGLAAARAASNGRVLGPAAVRQGGFEISSELGAPADVVWARVVTPAGINAELMPIVRMTVPSGAAGLDLDTAVAGQRLGRSWLLLGGFLPFDYDDITIEAIERGRRFQEDSTMLSQRSWRHERTVARITDGTCSVTDRVSFVPRVPVPVAVLRAVFRLTFAHRHRRLRRQFGTS